MYTEMSLKEALKYFMKGRKVLVLNEYDDKSISAERIEDCLPKEAKYLVDVPAVPNPEFEQAVREMVEAGEDDIYRDELDPDEIIQDETREGPTPTEPEERMEKETVDLPADNTKEKKEIIRKLVEEGYTNNEISDQTGIPYGTVYMHAKRKREHDEADMTGDNSDRHKCRTCQYRHSDAGGCDVEVCDKAVVGERLTKK